MAFVDEYKVTEISGFPYLLLEMNHLKEITHEKPKEADP